MALSRDLLAQRNKLEHEILALERSLGTGSNIADLLPTDSDTAEESDDSGHADEDVAHEDLQAERQQIQEEIEELERKLGEDAALVDAVTDSEQTSLTDSNDEDSDRDLDLPHDLETCLQMNLVYQEVVKEKLAELERLLNENREQQKDLEEQLSGPSYIHPGIPQLKLFLGRFMKPYFKDKHTSLGPPANEETKERLAHRTKPCDEMNIRRWKPWQKALLITSIAADTMKRMLQPKLAKMEYLNAKKSSAEGVVKEELQKQITDLEKDITEIRSLKEDQLYGGCHDYHDWDKIANIDFEGLRQPEDLMRFWQNYLHPSINKSTWQQDEISKLEEVVDQYKQCHWDKIAEALGTGRTAFMCFQTYQRYLAKHFRKKEWTKEEDQVFIELVEKMRIGNFIPYTQISYFMEGRDCSQLGYRWTCVLDPSIKKGPWTKEEDELLLKAVKKYKCKEWWKIRLEVPGRTDNSCRDRYLDCLQEHIKKGTWSDDEVELLKELVAKHGVGKWAKISAEIPHRLDSQCLHKWKWIVHTAERNGVRKRRKKRSVRFEPFLKRRRVRGKTLRTKKEKDDFFTESDTSEDETEQVPYMDSDAEQEEKVESSDEDCTLEYVQPDMKDWIPTHQTRTMPPGTLRTLLVRMPTEEEEHAKVCVRNTVLDKKGHAVKTYVGAEPPAFQKDKSSNDEAMLMVSEADVKRLLNCMCLSVLKGRPNTKTPTSSLSSCTNQKYDAKNKKEESNTKKKPVRRPVNSARLNYNLMVAITPWIGNVVMPLPFSERQACEADIVQKRASEVPLQKTSVLVFFLQTFKIDVYGCKKVILARKDKVSSPSRPKLKKPTPGSYRHGKTIADMLAEKEAEKKKQSKPLTFPEHIKLLPQPAQTAIPSIHLLQSKTNQERQSTSQQINATLILPQTLVVTQPNANNIVGTSHNVVQGIVPFLPLGTQDASKMPRLQSAISTKPASSPTTSGSTTEPPTKGKSTSKRRHKPTVKAQALTDEKITKTTKKRAAKQQQNSTATKTVAIKPQATTWILTPTNLMPVSGIQLQAPGIKAHQNQEIPNNLQLVFQPSVIVNQSTCVEPTSATAPSNPTSDLPANNNKSLSAGSNIDQKCRPSSVSGHHSASSLPSSNFLSVISVIPDTKLPGSIIGSAVKVLPSKNVSNVKESVTPTSPMSSLVPVSPSLVRTSGKHTSTNSVSNVPLMTAVTSTPSNSFHPLTISGPQSQRMPHPVTQIVFQQPAGVNQNCALALVNTAVSCQLNAPPAATTANVTMAPTNSTSPNTSKRNPASSKSSLALINAAGPCLIENASPAANITQAPAISTAPNINKSLSASSNKGSLGVINTSGVCQNKNDSPTAPSNVPRVPSNTASPNVKKSHPTSSTTGPVTPSYVLIPTSVLPSTSIGTSHAIPQPILLNRPVGVNVGGLPKELCVNPSNSPVTSSQIVFHPMPFQAQKQSVQETVTTSNPSPNQNTFNPNLMFFEQPDQVNNWKKGNGGITLPGLEDKMPYLPPFVSSIKTLSTLLEGRDSLLKSAAQLLPEEQRDGSDEEAKIAAVRKMVSDRFKTNKAYLLLKARFLSCFTLPALLATINPHRKSNEPPKQENNMERLYEDEFW